MTQQEQKDQALKYQLEVYALAEAELRQKQTALRDLAQRIVDAHCPYKVGDHVVYAEWWEPNKMKTGVVCHKPQLYVDEDSLDGLWRIIVQPTTKEGVKHRGKHPVHLGHNKLDSMKHAEVQR